MERMLKVFMHPDISCCHGICIRSQVNKEHFPIWECYNGLLRAFGMHRNSQAQSIAFIHYLAQRKCKKVHAQWAANINILCNLEGRTCGIKRLRKPDAGLGNRKLALLSGINWIHLRLQEQRTRAAREKKKNILYRLNKD